MNFGVCLDSPGTFSCVCVPGYTGNNYFLLAMRNFNYSNSIGKSCETIFSPCQALQPCLSDAKCLDDFENSSSSGGFHCECPPGRNGTQCEETNNPCSQVNCQNGGTCLPDPTTDAGISLAARYTAFWLNDIFILTTEP
jgi:Notch 4